MKDPTNRAPSGSQGRQHQHIATTQVSATKSPRITTRPLTEFRQCSRISMVEAISPHSFGQGYSWEICTDCQSAQPPAPPTASQCVTNSSSASMKKFLNTSLTSISMS